MQVVGTLFSSILAALIALPISRYDRDEEPADRLARLETVASAISDVAGVDKRLAAFIIEDGRAESGYRRDVQECRCPVGQCDWDKYTKRPRANGLWQIHKAPSWTADDWAGFCGTNYAAARKGAERVAMFYTWKRGNMACAFAALGGVSDCSWREAVERQRRAEKVAAKLRGGEK